MLLAAITDKMFNFFFYIIINILLKYDIYYFLNYPEISLNPFEAILLTPIPTHCDVIDTAHKIGLSLWADEKAAQTESVPAVLRGSVHPGPACRSNIHVDTQPFF